MAYDDWPLGVPRPYFRAPAPRRHTGRTVATVLAAAFVLVSLPIAGRAVFTGDLQHRLDRELPRLRAFVEEHRGLEFRYDVPVHVLGDATFDELFGDDEPAETDAEADFGATLTALHLVQPEDGGEGGDTGEGSTLDGFYDYETEDIVVRGNALTPYVRMVVVHELTHALQDQHFDFERTEEDIEYGDAWVAWQALVEGDATYVEYEYFATLPEADRVAIEGDTSGGEEVDAVTLLETFPYDEGFRFAEALRIAGGVADVDAAFRDPPDSTEQVLHRDRYRLREPVSVPDEPAHGMPVVDRGTLGELGLQVLLDLGSDEFPGDPLGWAGDRYVTWSDGGRTCAEVRVRFDSTAARDALVRRLHGQAEGTRDLLFQSCYSLT